MTGTPTSNGICDIWHQVLLLDNGKRRLAPAFRFPVHAVSPRRQARSANHLHKVGRQPGIEDAIISLISDISIRHHFRRASTFPRTTNTRRLRSSTKHRKIYEQLENDSPAIIGKDLRHSEINGAVLATKLRFQAASGAVYNDDGEYSPIATDR